MAALYDPPICELLWKYRAFAKDDLTVSPADFTVAARAQVLGLWRLIDTSTEVRDGRTVDVERLYEFTQRGRDALADIKAKQHP